MSLLCILSLVSVFALFIRSNFCIAPVKAKLDNDCRVEACRHQELELVKEVVRCEQHSNRASHGACPGEQERDEGKHTCVFVLEVTCDLWDAGHAVHEDAAASDDWPGRLRNHGIAEKPETVAREKRAENKLLNNADRLVVVVDKSNYDYVLANDDGVLSVV